MRYLLWTFLATILMSGTGLAQQANSSPVKWYTIEEALQLSKTNPRKIFIDVYTDWCGWCKRMDATTFKNPVIVDYLNNKYYAVKFNAESKQPVQFGTQTFVNKGDKQRSPHQFAVALLNGKMSYPSTAYLDESMQLLSAVPGFKGAKDLETILAFFYQEAYKTTSYKEFSESFQNKVP